MYEYKIKEILKIYDGDTITVVIDLGFGVFKTEKLRLAFIDAPELRGEEHDDGIKSRDWLRKKLYEAVESKYDIIIKTLKDRKGKYGRYIAELFINGESINLKMLEEGLAIRYTEG
jgi:micrococcal nuclease